MHKAFYVVSNQWKNALWYLLCFIVFRIAKNRIWWNKSCSKIFWPFKVKSLFSQRTDWKSFRIWNIVMWKTRILLIFLFLTLGGLFLKRPAYCLSPAPSNSSTQPPCNPTFHICIWLYLSSTVLSPITSYSLYGYS